jgi:hypothetical protein
MGFRVDVLGIVVKGPKGAVRRNGYFVVANARDHWLGDKRPAIIWTIATVMR